MVSTWRQIAFFFEFQVFRVFSCALLFRHVCQDKPSHFISNSEAAEKIKLRLVKLGLVAGVIRLRIEKIVNRQTSDLICLKYRSTPKPILWYVSFIDWMSSLLAIPFFFVWHENQPVEVQQECYFAKPFCSGKISTKCLLFHSLTIFV